MPSTVVHAGCAAAIATIPNQGSRAHVIAKLHCYLPKFKNDYVDIVIIVCRKIKQLLRISEIPISKIIPNMFTNISRSIRQNALRVFFFFKLRADSNVRFEKLPKFRKNYGKAIVRKVMRT